MNKQEDRIDLSQYTTAPEINFGLANYITLVVVPQYHTCDEGHGPDHIFNVIKRSLHLARHLKMNVEIAYVVAAFHDLGLTIGPREVHEKNSGALIDRVYRNRLKEWFTDEQITIIKEAAEDHRASSDREPRSIYGKIVSDADKDIENYSIVILRAFKHGKHLNPDFTYEEEMARVKQHLIKKFGVDGYVKFYFPWDATETFMKDLKRLTEDDELFEKKYRQIISKY